MCIMDKYICTLIRKIEMIKYKTYTVIIGSSVEYIPTSQLNTIANNIVDCKLKTDAYYD